MPQPNLLQLQDYQSFAGRHWETGSVHNHWAYRRFKAPHTQQPYSEALLRGISGGIVMGYFSFAYQGYDPHVAILTRNTFDPLDTLLTRLGVEQNLYQTANPKKAVQNLTETLKEGVPPLVWADQYSLAYNALPQDAGMWQMAPLWSLAMTRQALQETRQLMVQRHRAFLERGNATSAEMCQINARLAAIQSEVTEVFPLNSGEIDDLRGQLARQILHIHDLEQTAIELLKRAIQ